MTGLEQLTDHLTKSERVYAVLQEAILSGRIRPGTKLVIREVARELGVSESPVREAIKQLETKGLVEFRPYIGAVVTAPTPESVAEVFLLRSVLEPLAAETSLPFLGPDDVDDLRKILEEMRNCAGRAEAWNYSKADRRFHRVLYGRCPHRRLLSLVCDLQSESERARAIFHLSPASMPISLAEHEEMLRVVESMDAGKLSRLVKEQMLRVGREFVDALRSADR